MNAYVYLAEILTYGGHHPIKIGVSKDPRKRMRGLMSMHITCPGLRAYYEFPRDYCFKIEREACKTFPRTTYPVVTTREALDVPLNEIAAFIEAFQPISIWRCEQWVR